MVGQRKQTALPRRKGHAFSINSHNDNVCSPHAHTYPSHLAPGAKRTCGVKISRLLTNVPHECAHVLCIAHCEPGALAMEFGHCVDLKVSQWMQVCFSPSKLKKAINKQNLQIPSLFYYLARDYQKTCLYDSILTVGQFSKEFMGELLHAKYHHLYTALLLDYGWSKINSLRALRSVTTLWNKNDHW